MKNSYKLWLISGLMLGGTVFSSTNNVAAEEIEQIKARGSITPDAITRTVVSGETISLERQVTIQIDDIIETSTVAPDKLDVLFLADNTDSMGSAIKNVQDNAEALLNKLTDTYKDLEVGVARYYGDPQEQKVSWEKTGAVEDYEREYTYLNESRDCSTSQGETYLCYKYQVTDTVDGETRTWTSFVNEQRYLQYGQFHRQSGTRNIWEKVTAPELGANKAYQLQTQVNGGSLSDAIAAINDWSASSGGDWSEGSFFGLHQAATSGGEINGYATGDLTNWRDDAKKIIVWFGDAKSHTNTVKLEQAIEALKTQDISVVAIHTHSTPKSYEQGLDANSQASTIAGETNGAFASVFSSDLADTMVSLIGDSAVETIVIKPKINLNFSSTGDTQDLEISYSCSDDLGCEDVGDNETRKFMMKVTGSVANEYKFKTIVDNVIGAEADNTINVLYSD